MKILQLVLSTKCNSLIRICSLQWCQDALEMAAWENNAAKILESWFKINTSRRNYFLEKGIQISICCTKGTIYLIIAFLKIRRVLKRETTKSIIVQTKLSHRIIPKIGNSSLNSSNCEWAGFITSCPKKDFKMILILSTLISESKSQGTSFITPRVDAMEIKITEVVVLVEGVSLQVNYCTNQIH